MSHHREQTWDQNFRAFPLVMINDLFFGAKYILEYSPIAVWAAFQVFSILKPPFEMQCPSQVWTVIHMFGASVSSACV